MKRIMIIGQPGSGKSTLARQMGDITGLPVIHRDQLLWSACWIEPDNAEEDRLCLEAEARDTWIFEGGHSRTWANRLDRADMLIWLDFPLGLRTLRVIRRTLEYHGRTRPDLPDNCPERFDPEFYRWIWTTRHSAHAKMQALFDAAPPHKIKARLRTRAEVDTFLKVLPSSGVT